MMKKQMHQNENFANQILERGVMVFEELHRLTFFETPMAIPVIIICLIHQGSMKTKYDMNHIDYHSHDLALVPPGHIMMVQETSNEFSASIIAILPQFIERLNDNHSFTYEHIEYHHSTAYHLDDDQYKGVLDHFQMLRAITQLNHPRQEELLAKQIEIGAELIEIYLQQNGYIPTTEFTSEQNLINQFQNAIVNHFQESREVQFYAKLLCYSPKYFGSIIKQQTGIAANELIARYVIIQAKSRLQQRHDFNIQQISYQLGFTDPAAFTRFFKANTGMSPKEYREQQNNIEHST